MIWRTSKREFECSQKTLLMGILNATPDSFSDGGAFFSLDDGLRQAETLIAEGAEVLDIGGESTRPNSAPVLAEEEIRRVVPLIEQIAQRFPIAISIDTTKSAVARAAIEAGAEIINDISGLRFDPRIADVAAQNGTGLILMHSRGNFETMHKLPAVEQVLPDVIDGLRASAENAVNNGVAPNKIALDIGIGFSKTYSQNLELLGQLDKICHHFADFPILVGTSRKSFIGKILGDAKTSERLFGTLSSVAIAVFNGARIVRVHDVKAARDAVRVAEEIRNFRSSTE